MKKEYIISLASLMISVSALLLAYIRSEPIEISWAEVLVGTLSVLVTILIGYQIYNAVSVEKSIRSIRKSIRGELDLIQKENNKNVVHSILLQSQSLRFPFGDNSFLLGLSALRLAFKYDTENADECIDHILKTFGETQKTINSANAEIARETVYSVSKEYKRIDELRSFINGLKILDGDSS